MARMSITVDEELVIQVKQALGAPTKTEAIRLALLDVLRRQRLAEVLRHQGQVEINLDQSTLQKLRESG